jgi:hypothetical protein
MCGSAGNDKENKNVCFLKEKTTGLMELENNKDL